MGGTRADGVSVRRGGALLSQTISVCSSEACEEKRAIDYAYASDGKLSSVTNRTLPSGELGARQHLQRDGGRLKNADWGDALAYGEGVDPLMRTTFNYEGERMTSTQGVTHDERWEEKDRASYEYSAEGRLSVETYFALQRGEAVALRKRRYTYSAEGRLEQVLTERGIGGDWNPESRVVIETTNAADSSAFELEPADPDDLIFGLNMEMLELYGQVQTR